MPEYIHIGLKLQEILQTNPKIPSLLSPLGGPWGKSHEVARTTQKETISPLVSHPQPPIQSLQKTDSEPMFFHPKGARGRCEDAEHLGQHYQ